MLRHIIVKNIALIRELELDFAAGLTVLTGETGAGKSLIVDALNFILGAKADRTLISHGTDRATVEALFSVTETVTPVIKEYGYECEDGEVLIVRSLTEDGKSEIRINGKVATLAILRGVTSIIADIHGQHEHQSLLNAASHIVLLDGFAGEAVVNAKEELKPLVVEFRAVKKKLAAIGGSDEERAREIDILKYQIEKIERSKLSVEEEEILNRKYYLATNAEKLSDGLKNALSLINGHEGSLNDLGRASVAIDELSRFDSKFLELSKRVKSAYLEIDDVYSDMSAYLDDHSVDSKEIDSIIDRMEEYKRLKRKYGATVSDVLKFLNSSRERYDQLLNSAELQSDLTAQLESLKIAYAAKAVALTAFRVDAARRLEGELLGELEDLGMGGSQFEVKFVKRETLDLSIEGTETAEFYLSTNKGEPPKPLNKVISGGEMSRFMLALKVIAAESDGIETIVFDEIDTGISGKVGEAIAHKMARLSRTHQILCISHLPTIAAMADSHYLIEKQEVGDKTQTFVRALDRDGMIREISRLVGGSDIGEHGISHSAELKDWSDRVKSGM